MSLEPYSFCFLRYVHDPLSAEFANIGVVLWAPESRFLGFRFSPKYRRLSRFFQGFESGDYRQLVSRVSTQFERLQIELNSDQESLPFEKEPEHARDLAMRVIPQDDNALQWSLSAGGVTADPLAELESLFRESISRHYENDLNVRRDDSGVFRQIYSPAFEAPEVKPHIQEHEVNAPLATYRFEHAWKNGVWNVYQALSFDLKKAEDIHEKAYRWESRSRYLHEAAEKPEIHLLLGRPLDSKSNRAYGMAKDILSAAKVVKIVEEDEAGHFATELASEIKRSV